MMVWLSGETSSESHVPSLMVNSILRDGFSGRGSSFFTGAFLGVVEGPCFWGSASDVEIRTEKAISGHTNRRRIERRMQFSGREVLLIVALAERRGQGSQAGVGCCVFAARSWVLFLGVSESRMWPMA